MNNTFQQLLEDKYPASEISDIQRRAFEEGYNVAIKAIGKFGQKKGNESLTPFVLLTQFVNQDYL